MTKLLKRVCSGVVAAALLVSLALPGSAFAASSSDGYSVSMDGFSYTFGYYVTVNASTGKMFYGDTELTVFPSVSGYSYYTMIKVGSYYYLWLSSSVPYFDGESVNFGTNKFFYQAKKSSASWTAMSDPDVLGITDPSIILFLNYDMTDSSGTVLVPAMSPSSTGLSSTSMTLSATGSESDTLISGGKKNFGAGTPITYVSAGATGEKYQFSNSAMEGYVDYTYPAEVFGIVSGSTFESLEISGDFTADTYVGPYLVNSSSGTFYCVNPFSTPSSMQIIFNGSVMSDTFELTYNETNSFVYCSGLDLSYENFTTLDSVTFRLYYSVPSYSSSWMTLDEAGFSTADSFTIGASCELQALPTFTVYGASGGDSSGSSGGTFDDSNIVEWLEKIYNRLHSWFTSVDAYFAEELTILNDILEAVKDNSAVESVSSTVTNIYNSISNVESTINNVSNTVTEMNNSISNMEDDSSAIRDMYASDQDLQLKEDTAPIVQEVADTFFGSDSDTAINTETVQDTQTVLQGAGVMFDSGYEISDVFEEIGSNDDFMLWFSADVAYALDSTGSAASLSDEDDPFNHWRYEEQLDAISNSRGGDD